MPDSLFDIANAAKAFVSYHVTEPPPQAIESLRVEPGPDLVNVSFTTRYPTIPMVEILTANGELVTSTFAIFGGAKKKHRGTFGLQTPLPQGTKFQLRISAPGQQDLGITSAVRTVGFTTGRREVTVFFDRIEMQNDGDSGWSGAGDFLLEFKAGDARDQANSHATSLERDMNNGDRVDLGVSFPLAPGPREIYVSAYAIDKDDWPGGSYIQAPPWGQPINTGHVAPAFDAAEVGDVVDVSEAGSGTTTIPFTLQTGTFTVAFAVTGRIVVTVFPGRGVRTLKEILDEMFAAGTLWKNEALVVVGNKKEEGSKGLAAGLGSDGQLWTKSTDPAQPISRSQGWQLAAKAPRGPVTAIWTAEDRAEIVAVSERGIALRLVDGEWRELGGSFQGALIGIPGEKGGADLIGLTSDGKIAHRPLPGAGDERGDWRVSGEAIRRGLCAVPLDAGATALFAIGRDDHPVHALFENGAIRGWQPLGDFQAAWLAARRYDDGMGLIVAAVTEKRQLHILSWRNYPKPPKPDQWSDAGPYDEVIPPLATPELHGGTSWQS